MQDKSQNFLSLRSKLTGLFERNGFTLKNKEADLFLRYFSILSEGSTQLNLTSILDFDEVLVKHFLDSIIPLHLIPQNAKVCDIGSGAGLPGIPLKIIRSDISLTMVESITKKTNFLNKAIASLELKETNVLPLRAEIFGKTEGREKYDIVTARALAPLEILLEYALPLVQIGGKFIAYKGPSIQKELSSANLVAPLLSGELLNTYEYSLNNQYARTLAVYTKTGSTPLEYPRETRVIKKKPLSKYEK